MARMNCMCCLHTVMREGTNVFSIVFAFDPTDADPYSIPLGKQTLEPSHIFYRPCSGIWQSVWIESVPSNHITDLSIDANAKGQVNLTANATGSNSSKVEITVYERASIRLSICMTNVPLIMSTGNQEVCSFAQWHCRLANYIQRQLAEDVVPGFAKSVRCHDQAG